METNGSPTQQPKRWRKAGVIGLVFGTALAAAVGIAWATGAMPALGHGFCRAGLGRDFVEFRIHKALAQVSATDAQEQQIMTIVDGLFAQHQAMAGLHQEMHDRLLAALAGPTVDRVALEAVRADAVTKIDEATKTLAKSVGDIAEILTPAQRQQLAALAKQHMQQ